MRPQNWRVSLLSLALAAASIPIYLHVPTFAATQLGLSLTQIGAILLLIRIVDFVQDPVLGWMADRWAGHTGKFGALALGLLSLGCVIVFSVPENGHTALLLTAGLVIAFTGYSLGMILLYGQSAAFAGSGQTDAQLRLAVWRESGILVGVLIGAMAPTAFGVLTDGRDPYAGFGWLIAVLALVAGVAARPLWRLPRAPAELLDWRSLIRVGGGWLLLLAFVNSLPVAVTSTLFLFFVEDRLALPDLAGPFLILFFLAAGLSAPLWSRLAQAISPRLVLVLSMSLSIISFVGAFALPSGAALAFGVICVASGAALGADMVILAALFSAALARAGMQAGQAFGIWNFSAKATLAIAAGVMLPLLQHLGYTPAGANDPAALQALNISYALVPCALKLCAIGLVICLPRRVFG
ncbi:MFS transporter [Donghicola mangrovi]|uniref:Sodium:galactoside symporter n=1 Tax=Donghicola mangrovi TaxID=2729614 RepID=A0A850Q4P1_9RHOB|nr:MFS transporter [Donghicola mangrovi]NVO24677.1 sodium:galactoside symporter [Donghicola mangrovi]